jgi:Na+/H+ antiporter
LEHLLPTVIGFLALIGLASVAAPRLRMPTPVMLALSGIAWSMAPYVPSLSIDPHLVLAVFLPPLLYADAWDASWHDFRRWLRPILSLAIGLVAFTILVVGVAAKAILPDLPWAACFLLGAIVSPTDTVAVHAVLERLRIPRRVTAILGGESLMNDATGLLGVQLALIVMSTGVFEAGAVAVGFLKIAGLGIVCGVAVGLIAVGVNRWVRGTTVLFVFSILAPYLAYAVAEKLGASGILAVVVAGFVASWRIELVPAESRVGLYEAWDILTFILNGLMFLFVGFVIPDDLPRGSGLIDAIRILWPGLAIAGVVIASRLVWFWPAAYIPLSLFPKLREREGGYPQPSAIVLGSWCGVRGAVSLAAALALPIDLPDGTPFPGRASIEMCVLVTIMVTLLGQGWTIGPLVRWLKLPSDPASEAEIRRAREAMLVAGIARLDEFCTDESCPIAVYRYRDSMNDQLAEFRDLDDTERARASRRLAVSRDVHQAVRSAQSNELLRLRDAGQLNDIAYQDLQLELDRAGSPDRV